MTSEDGHNVGKSDVSPAYQAYDMYGTPLGVCSIVRESGFYHTLAIIEEIRPWESFGDSGLECHISFEDDYWGSQWICDKHLISAEHPRPELARHEYPSQVRARRIAERERTP